MPPITSSAPLIIDIRSPIVPVNAFFTASQFVFIADARPTAPNAINAIPRGMFAPENAKIAPRPSSDMLTYAVSSSILFLYSSVLNSPKSGDISPPPPPPLSLWLAELSLLISSKDANCFAAFFAALPVPLIAFVCLFNAFALSAICLSDFPPKIEKI